MSQSIADRNLLIGLLGLQLELFTSDQFASAMQVWLKRKQDHLEAILLQQNVITIQQFDFLRGIAEKHIAMHGQDPIQSLAALSSFESMGTQLKELNDPDVDQTLTRATQLRDAKKETSQFSCDRTVDFEAKSPLIRERFRILRPHAKGGLGQVSIAEDAELHREVALKEIQPLYAKDPQSRSRFMIEAELTGRLEHPGIVPVYSLGKTVTGNPYYVMRFIRGDSLKEAIESLYNNPQNLKPQSYRMIVRRLVKRLIDVCNAIEYAHSRGVLHRDLKPGNIMLGRYGETLVVDWGLAKTGSKAATFKSSDEGTFVPSSGEGSSETRLGTVVGTPAYMSPEQARSDADALGPASDVYSLGATLYCLLAGQAPIPKVGKEEMIARVVRGQIEPILKANPLAPKPLVAICEKAMALNPADRYATPMQLAEELEQWLADEPISAYAEPLIDRGMRFVRKHRAMVTSLLAVLITGLVALVANSVVMQRKNRDLQVARDEARKSEQVAIEEEQRATSSLKVAKAMAITLWSAAEKTLSSLAGPEVQRERSKFTEQAYQSLKTMIQHSKDDPDLDFEFAKVARISANLYRLMQDYNTAEIRINESLDYQLKHEKKASPSQLDHLAETYREIATLQSAQGSLNKALDALQRSRTILKQLMENEPDNSNYKRTMATADLEEGRIDQDLLNFDAALEKVRRATVAFEKLSTSAAPAATDALLHLASKTRQILILSDSGRSGEAIQAADSALESFKRYLEVRPNDTNAKLFEARANYWKAEAILQSGGDLDAALALAENATQTQEKLLKLKVLPSFTQGLIESLRIQGRALRMKNNLTESETRLMRSREEASRLLAAGDDPGNRELLARTCEQLALTKEAAGDKSAAASFWKEAIDNQSKLCERASEQKSAHKYLESLKLQQTKTP